MAKNSPSEEGRAAKTPFYMGQPPRTTKALTHSC
jgi:hypothetical protein